MLDEDLDYGVTAKHAPRSTTDRAVGLFIVSKSHKVVLVMILFLNYMKTWAVEPFTMVLEYGAKGPIVVAMLYTIYAIGIS